MVGSGGGRSQWSFSGFVGRIKSGQRLALLFGTESGGRGSRPGMVRRAMTGRLAGAGILRSERGPRRWVCGVYLSYLFDLGGGNAGRGSFRGWVLGVDHR